MRKKTYHIITIGCQMNVSDSERIAGYLEELGFRETDKRNRATLVVMTTCGVRQSAEDRAYMLLPQIKKENPKVITVVTGCLSGRADVQTRLKDSVDLWLPIIELPKLEHLINKKQRKQSVIARSGATRQSRVVRINPEITTLPAVARDDKEGSLGGYLNINPKYSSSFSAFVPIGNGCNNFCAYCVVPYARGREVYRPAEEILAEVRGLVKRGYKEIILIAQNVNSYNFQFSILNFQSIFNFNSSNFKIDSKFEIRNSKLYEENKIVEVINFPILLRLVDAISGNFWIRFATSHPKDMSDELIKTVAGCEKVCRQIHLPAQAGDNEVLKRMNRKYTREHYLRLIKKIRRAMPGASISTDVIVGFPGESKKQFQNTEKLFRQAEFDQAFISKYSPRPDTVAAKMNDNISKIEKKRREEALMKILRRTALANNRHYIGRPVEILLEGRKRDCFFGKTKTGKNVRIKGGVNLESRIGELINTRITRAEDFGIYGKLEKYKPPGPSGPGG